jgi:hypothetical protein
MKVYLAGPMSGIKSFNIPAFQAATKVLRDNGHIVISPVELDGAQDRAILLQSEHGDHKDLPRPYEEYLSNDHITIRGTPDLDAIVCLPGWENSFGALSEVDLAASLGIPSYPYDSVFGMRIPDKDDLYDADGKFITHADNPLRQRTVTGGVKDNRGKLPVDLIPYEALRGAAEVLAYGAIKYKPNNWRLGLKWMETWSSLQRHLWAWKEGEDLDPETGKSHIDHAMCQMLFLATYVHDPNMAQFDDRWINSDHNEAKA